MDIFIFHISATDMKYTEAVTGLTQHSPMVGNCKYIYVVCVLLSGYLIHLMK